MKLRHFCTIPSLVFMVASGASAATWTWDGGGADNNWTTAANWNPNSVPDSLNTTDLFFAGSTRLAPVVDLPWTIDSLTFSASAGNFTLSGSALTLNGSLTVEAGRQMIQNAITLGAPQMWLAESGWLELAGNVALNGQSLSLSTQAGSRIEFLGVLSGSGALSINGPGAVDFHNLNTYSGTITLGTDANLTAAADGITGLVVTSTGSTLEVSAFGSRTFAGTASGAGKLRYSGSSSGTSVLTVTNSQAHTGGTEIESAVIVDIGGSSLRLGPSSSTVTFTGGGTVRANATTNISQSFVLNGSGGIFDVTGGSPFISGGISGGGTLTKTGAGLLRLAANNSFSGGIQILGGTLQADTDARLGSSSGDIFLNGGTFRTGAALTTTRAFSFSGAGGTLDTNGFDLTLNGSVLGAGAIIKSGTGTVILGGSPNHTGPLTVNGGTFRMVGGIAQNAVVTIGTGGVLQLPLGSSFQWANFASTGTLLYPSASLAFQIAQVTFGQDGGDTTISGSISGSGRLIKTGAGTATVQTSLAGLFSNNIDVNAGGLTVNAGRVLIPNASNAPNVSFISDGGILELGNGSFGGAIYGATVTTGFVNVTTGSTASITAGSVGGNT
jgi:fibronectin-binding autotransporter adhesin